MPSRAGLVVVLAVLALAACSGPPDIAGFYQVASIESAVDACDGGAAPDPAPSHFLVRKDSFFGTTIYQLDLCDDGDRAACQGNGGGGGFVFEEIDDGYRGEVSGYSGTPEDGCLLFYTDLRATLIDGTLTWSRYQYAEDGASGDDCTTDEAAARGASMPCAGYLLVSGPAVE
jgi:hypothetical protein